MDLLSVIIVAGGTGKRMGRPIPKQFLMLGNRPILMHTMQRFYKAFADLKMRIILVLNKDYEQYWQELVRQYSFPVPHITTFGGEQRFHSVKNGLSMAFDQGLVAVHDSVRPLITTTFLRSVYEQAKQKGNAVPCVLPHSSVRIEEKGRNWSIDRSTVRLIQTPQIFDIQDLRKAYSQEYRTNFTDDAIVFESLGKQINLVQGLEENIKITRPIDLFVAEKLIKEIDQ